MQVVIGLAGHAQITPRFRLLSGAPTAFEPEPEPNSQVSLINPGRSRLRARGDKPVMAQAAQRWA